MYRIDFLKGRYFHGEMRQDIFFSDPKAEIFIASKTKFALDEITFFHKIIIRPIM